VDIHTLLEQTYGLNNIRLSRLTHGLVDTNYQVLSSEGVFFLKLYKSISEVALTQLHKDLKSLKRTRLPVPVEIPKQIDFGHPHHQYALYEFVRGEKYTCSLPQMEAAARLFGEVVCVGTDKCTQTTAEALLGDLFCARQNLTITKKAPLPRELDGIDEIFVRLSDMVDRRIRLSSTPNLDNLPLHPDFTERNLLFKGNDIVLLCDWQGYGPRLLVYELFCAFLRFCTRKPFEGYLLDDRVARFQDVLSQSSELLRQTIQEYAHLFPWLLIHRQICNAPFRIAGMLGPADRGDFFVTILLWSKNLVDWLLNNESKVIGWLTERKNFTTAT
jgi:Ser/Thr protein kinase RdoA (MazF antagonist)